MMVELTETEIGMLYLCLLHYEPEDSEEAQLVETLLAYFSGLEGDTPLAGNIT